ncbi:3'(2'),5'-bisphosphate nucleotidase CysQ [Gottschalkiaceae bacterium SANA]|nr:3'(2'),5'-bisphosphate nucleotidase CysQ [Gottschalkiaceae bacterium SANA]
MKEFEINHLKELAIEAGQAIMKIYQTDFDVAYKGDQSPLTLADQEANGIIVDGLEKYYPNYAILSEEVADDKSRMENAYCFIVDPLDGTKEFVNRNGEFTVNIALVYQGKPIVGVIYVPVSKQLYYSVKGEGTYREQVDSGLVEELRVSKKVSQLTWIGSKSHSSEKEENLIADHRDLIKESIVAGSSLKGCRVAEGQADVYYRFGLTCEWDTAAMQCIVEEAGGIFRQMDGSEMLYNRENTLNEKGFYVVNQRENIWV